MKNEKMQLGDSFYAKSKYEAALNCYLDALFQMDATAELYNKIGDCNTRLGDLENAEEYYQFARNLGEQKVETELPSTNNAADPFIAIKKELHEMLIGNAFMHNQKAIGLINQLIETPVESADAVFQGDGSFRFIIYTSGKTLEVCAGEGEAEILINEA